MFRIFLKSFLDLELLIKTSETGKRRNQVLLIVADNSRSKEKYNTVKIQSVHKKEFYINHSSHLKNIKFGSLDKIPVDKPKSNFR